MIPGDLVLVDYSSEGDCEPLPAWAEIRAAYFIAAKVDGLPGHEPPAIHRSTLLMIISPGGAPELISLARVLEIAPGAE